MSRARYLAVLAAAAALAACGGSSGKVEHPIGAESFVSSAPRGTGPFGAADNSGRPNSESPTAGAPGADRGAATPREVEESDLYARSGTTLLVQNVYRGLQVVDLADPTHPQLLARLPLSGTPVGLYLRGSTAVVLARDHLDWRLAEDGAGVAPGSRIWTVDVSRPDQPRVLAEVAVKGQIQDSRLVGDVLYVFTGGWSWWWWAADARGGVVGDAAPDLAPWTPGDSTVASFDLSDLAHPAAVDVVTFPATTWGYELHANVTDKRITLARPTWDGSGAVTDLVAVDASDPGGHLELGAQVKVKGSVIDRWGLDLDEASGTFRVVAADGWNTGANLTVLSWAEPASASILSELHVDVAETLTAARFDGVRGYLVTARQIDPLWVVDLRDPAHPAVTGELTMPGRLDFLNPRGNRLLALGHTNEAGKPFQLHVSLIDVTDPRHPALLSRKPFGPDWAYVPTSADDLHKAFLLVGDLVLVPFEGWDQAEQRWLGGTQLLTLSGDALVLGGFVDHAGGILRAFPAGTPDVLGAFSNEKLQTIDAADRAHPYELAVIDLARPVMAIAVVGAAAAELSGEPWRGVGELVVVPSADPDAATPTARFETGSAWGRLFRNGAVVWTLLTDWRTGKTAVEGFDLSDPDAPVRRGKLELPPPPDGSGWWATDAVQAGRALAVHRASWRCGPASCEQTSQILVVDLVDPDAPALASTVDLPGRAWTGALRAVGTDLWYSQYEWTDDWRVRYHVGRVELSDPAHPVVHPPVNVPGTFFSASDDGRTVYTEEVAWPQVTSAGNADRPFTWLHALELTDRGTARLSASVKLPGVFYGAVRSGSNAYVAGGDYTFTGGVQHGLLAAVSLRPMQLVDLQKVQAPWPQVLAAAEGKLFLSQGWPVPAVLVYGISFTGKPVFEQAVETSGWSYEVVVADGYAYLPAGPYGVVRIEL